LALALLTSVALPLTTQAAQKQTHAAKATAKATATKKPVRKTKKGLPLKTTKKIEAATPVQTPSERLSDAELEIAQQVYTGTFPCELGTHVTVTADTAHPGFFTVAVGKISYYMHPVESRTGAIRLEDIRHSAVWLQLGSKSMLMDQKAGRRVSDDCKASAQQEYATHLQDHPQPQLLDKPPTDAPPADTPPADKPPTDTPPADKPSADTPPADKPPADTPPADKPPVDAPPADTPPADNQQHENSSP
jgi:hypothetical protein